MREMRDLVMLRRRHGVVCSKLARVLVGNAQGQKENPAEAGFLSSNRMETGEQFWFVGRRGRISSQELPRQVMTAAKKKPRRSGVSQFQQNGNR